MRFEVSGRELADYIYVGVLVVMAFIAGRKWR